MIFRGFIELITNSFHFTLKLYKKNFEINHFLYLPIELFQIIIF